MQNTPPRRFGLRLRRVRTLARVGAATGAASLGLYIGLLINQGGFPWAALIFVVIIGAGVIAAMESIGDPYRARRLLTGATIAFGIIGVLGITTIGMLFLLAALFTAIGAALSPKHPQGEEL
jgi:hypothetical protein